MSKELKNINESKPFQLDLFELKTGNERYYSNTIEFWDILPKSFYGRVNRKQVTDDKTKNIMNVLPSLTRKIKYKKQNEDGKRYSTKYNITINPAILVKKDKKTDYNISTYYYPSTREELIEEILRKFIASGKGSFLDDDISVRFSLREIQENLKESGHTYSITEIKESLDIMSKTHIEIVSEFGDIEYKGNIITSLALSKRGRGGTKCFCTLNPIVSRAIKQLKFRKYNYSKCMRYQIPLSRYIYKRISHYYKQIDKETPYIIKLSTLFNDSGYNIQNKMTKNYQKLVSSLEELKTGGTIVSYQIEAMKEKQVKMKIVDYKILIIPSDSFINDIIGANKKQKNDKFIKKLKT